MVVVLVVVVGGVVVVVLVMCCHLYCLFPPNDWFLLFCGCSISTKNIYLSLSIYMYISSNIFKMISSPELVPVGEFWGEVFPYASTKQKTIHETKEPSTWNLDTKLEASKLFRKNTLPPMCSWQWLKNSQMTPYFQGILRVLRGIHVSQVHHKSYTCRNANAQAFTFWDTFVYRVISKIFMIGKMREYQIRLDPRWLIDMRLSL